MIAGFLFAISLNAMELEDELSFDQKEILNDYPLFKKVIYIHSLSYNYSPIQYLDYVREHIDNNLVPGAFPTQQGLILSCDSLNNPTGLHTPWGYLYINYKRDNRENQIPKKILGALALKNLKGVPLCSTILKLNESPLPEAVQKKVDRFTYGEISQSCWSELKMRYLLEKYEVLTHLFDY